jgi:hypothetical protein
MIVLHKRARSHVPFSTVLHTLIPKYVLILCSDLVPSEATGFCDTTKTTTYQNETCNPVKMMHFCLDKGLVIT